MALHGDIRKLGLLQANLRRLAEVPATASREVAEQITGRLDAGFSAGTDPYGRGWAPLAPATLRKGRHPPPLTDTRRLRSGTVARPRAGAGVALLTGDAYGGYHQTGTRHMPARPILPRGSMPATWNAIIRTAVANAARRRMEGR